MARNHFKTENSAALVIKRPHITEKATNLSAVGAYTFVVDTRATKGDVTKAVKELYKVTPVKVNITNIPARNIMRKGIAGRVASFKKAVVYLKKGDTIELI
jgi:large subunit ribosomal protein L23